MIRMVFRFRLAETRDAHVLLAIHKFRFRKFVSQEIAIDGLVETADVRIAFSKKMWATCSFKSVPAVKASTFP